MNGNTKKASAMFAAAFIWNFVLLGLSLENRNILMAMFNLFCVLLCMAFLIIIYVEESK